MNLALTYVAFLSVDGCTAPVNTYVSPCIIHVGSVVAHKLRLFEAPKHPAVVKYRFAQDRISILHWITLKIRNGHGVRAVAHDFQGSRLSEHACSIVRPKPAAQREMIASLLWPRRQD